MGALSASPFPIPGAPSPSPPVALGGRARLSLAAGLVLLTAGSALLGAAMAAQGEADAYTSAPPCSILGQDSWPNCIVRERGTLRQASVSYGRTSDYASVVIAFPSGVQTLSLAGIDAVESQLTPGQVVTALRYRGHTPALEVGAWIVSSTDNPVYQARGIALIGLFVTGLGLAFLADLTLGMRRAGGAAPAVAAVPTRAASSLTLPLVLKPDAKNSRNTLLTALGGFLLLSLLAGTRLPASGAPGALAGIAALAGLFIFLRWLYLRNADIFVDDLHVGRHDLFGRARMVDRSLIRSVVLTMQEYTGRYGLRQVRRVFLVGSDGRAWLRLNGEFFARDEIDALAAAMRIPIEGSWSTPESASEVRGRIPGSFTWAEAHPYLLGFLLVPVIFLVLGVALFLIGQLH